MKRVLLFLVTNLAIVVLLGIVLRLLGVESILDQSGTGLNLGSLLIAGSRIPGEFVNWCRAGGRVQRVEASEAAEEAAAKASPARPISSVLPGR